jgi:hypothetical protein
VVYSSGGPGPQVVDCLVRCRSVELATQVGAPNDSENLSVHQMRSGLLRVMFQTFSHGLGVGSRENDLGDA